MPKPVAAFLLCCFLLAGPARAGFDDGLAAYNEGRFQAATDAFIPLAEAGDAWARFYLGHILYKAYPSEPGLTTCWVCGCYRQNVRLLFCHAQPLEIRPPDVPRRLRGALSR